MKWSGKISHETTCVATSRDCTIGFGIPDQFQYRNNKFGIQFKAVNSLSNNATLPKGIRLSSVPIPT